MEDLIERALTWAWNQRIIHEVSCGNQLDKIREELNEVQEELKGRDVLNLQNEIGDVLFSTITLSAQLGFDPKECLRLAVEKNEKRTGIVRNGTFIRTEADMGMQWK